MAPFNVACLKCFRLRIESGAHRTTLNKTKRRLHHRLGLLFLMLPVSVLAIAQSLRFDIPAQPLPTALRAFADQARIQLLYRHDAVKAATGNAVVGDFDPREALQMLLKGTGLEVVYSEDNAATIRPMQTGSKSTTAVSHKSEHTRLAQAESGSSQYPSSSAVSAETSESPSQSPVELEGIVVTGSRINRAATESSSPVVVFTRDEIARTGATSLQQLFTYLPQASINNDASGLVVFGGGTTIRLRGLPSGTTLVLINGRRAIPSGALFTANIFNLNNIPLAAVERVEVLTDSASAIYGADALAGVVNVILRKGVDDTELAYRYGSAASGDTESNRASLTTGFASERLKVMAFLEGFKQTPLQGAQIDRIANADYRRFGGPDRRSGLAAPGNVYAVPGTGNLPGLPATFAAIPAGQPGTDLTPASFVSTAGTLNSGALFALDQVDLVYDVERYSALARADFELTPSLRFFSEALFNDSEEINRTANFLFASFARVPSINPFNPFDADVRVDVLLPELPASRIFDWQYLRLLLGAGGSLGSWDWELGLLGSRDEMRERDTNPLDLARITAALNDSNPATALNPFVGEPIPASSLTGLLRNDVLLNFESQADQLDVQVRGPLGILPAGPIRWAVGGEARSETLSSDSPSGDRVPFDRDRDVRSGFVEALLPIFGESVTAPLLQRLALTAAVRYDSYSDFGSATSPQFGLAWTLSPQVSLRMSRGEAFRPPSLRQLFASQPLNFGITDPRRANERYTTPGLSGGNPNLEPEAGTSANVGLVFSPFSNARLVASADVWRVNLTERILQVSSTDALANEALFPELVTRAPPTPEDVAQGFPGRVTFLRSVFANFGEAKLEGVDLRLTLANNLFRGTLTNTLAATYVSRYEAAVAPGQPLTNRAGVAVADGYAPRVKASWIGSWQGGGWEISSGLRYIDSYQDYADPSGSRMVESSTLVDLGLGYAWPESAGAILGNAKLTANVTNVLDEEPPYSNALTGYDTLQADVLGRQIYLNLSKRF